MLETVGKKLAKSRKEKRLSIEDVEHETCIPHGRLRELEDDDYSQFANLTYAKSFLKLYSDFLEVDTADYRQELSLYEVDDFGSDPLSNEFAEGEEPRRRPALFALVVFLLLASLAGAYYFSEHYSEGKGNGDEGDPPVALGEGDQGGYRGDGDEDLNPNAKPPVEIPEEVRPATPASGFNPPPVIPETPSPGDPDPSPTVVIDDLPILPAVVIEDDELTSEDSSTGGDDPPESPPEGEGDSSESPPEGEGDDD